MVELRMPHGPMRLGPMRRFMKAMILSSMKMMTKAAGTVKSRTPVAAARKRRMPMLAPAVSRKPCTTCGPMPTTQSTVRATVPSTSRATSGRMILPPVLRCFQGSERLLTCRCRP